ncbi:acetyltransferase [Aurantivibrio infirmus]
MSNPVILLGCGGHAKVVYDALCLNGLDVIGVVDTSQPKGTEVFSSLKVLGGDDIIFEYSPTTIDLALGVGALPGIFNRQKLFNKFTDRGYRFKTLVHPSSTIASSVVLKMGVQVMAGAIIQADSIIEENCIINTSASIDHDCRVGRHSHLAPRSVLCGGVQLEENVFIGAGAVVIQNLIIKHKAIIGAGTMINIDVNEGLTVYTDRKLITYTGGDV